MHAPFHTSMLRPAAQAGPIKLWTFCSQDPRLCDELTSRLVCGCLWCKDIVKLTTFCSIVLFILQQCPIPFTSEVNSSQTSGKRPVNLSQKNSCDELTVWRVDHLPWRVGCMQMPVSAYAVNETLVSFATLVCNSTVMATLARVKAAWKVLWILSLINWERIFMEILVNKCEELSDV